ncbi:MAG: phosphate acyltransferase PlsX [Clostridia bacterium]|nr:phosphate acyltransferase PlsX [Clostridia bacterium]
MKIVVDVFGCDFPEKVIKGTAKAVREIQDVSLVVVGKENCIREILNGEEYDESRLEIINAEEVITNDESPSVAIRQKKNSSLRVAYKTLKEKDDCKALISCGSTGAVIVGSVLCLGRTDGIERPALASILPCENGKFTCLLDCGANVDCKPHQLVEFAKCASDFMRKTYGITRPTVSLLSVGTEDAKGNVLTKETFALLKESDLNFIGNMEGKTVLSGNADVIVADGFSGNVLLKAVEGVAGSVMKTFVGLLKNNANENTDFTFVKKAMGDFGKKYDFNSLGGAILLGTKKPVVKGHGAANEDTIVNTVKQAIKICTEEKPFE